MYECCSCKKHLENGNSCKMTHSALALLRFNSALVIAIIPGFSAAWSAALYPSQNRLLPNADLHADISHTRRVCLLVSFSDLLNNSLMQRTSLTSMSRVSD